MRFEKKVAVTRIVLITIGRLASAFACADFYKGKTANYLYTNTKQDYCH